jgi:hypothetical protein
MAIGMGSATCHEEHATTQKRLTKALPKKIIALAIDEYKSSKLCNECHSIGTMVNKIMVQI